MRIDFYIWTVRYFSSRSKATIACKNGEVTVNERRIKPSYEVLVNDIIEIKNKDKVYQLTVLDFPKSRVGTKLVDMYRMIRDVKSKKIAHNKINHSRKKGEGRPTKKDRGNLDKFLT